MAGVHHAVLMGATSGPSVTGGSTTVSGANSRVGAGNVTTTTSTANVGTISGGAAPYSYAWEYVSGDAATVNSPSLGSSTFTRTVAVALGQSISKVGIYRIKVTDANGRIAYGPNCTVTTDHSESS